jgi:Lrp/AsnC family leucine-responsive transcriptional regulator
MIDETDRKILTHLQQNARVPSSTIAKAIGMATSAVGERMRKLEERGIIEAYETRVNAEPVGLGLTAYMYVRTNEGAASSQTADSLVAIPEVQEVHIIAGEDCYLIKVRVEDTEALSNLLRNRIGQISTVVSTRTTIVLETFKETCRLMLPEVKPDAKKNKK